MGDDERPDLRKELDKRRRWFYECQLRHLNLAHFRLINADDVGNPRLHLISEVDESVPAGDAAARVYLDSRAPVWTHLERIRRNGLSQTFTGPYGDWLDFKDPHRLVSKLAEYKADFDERNIAPSVWDLHRLNEFGRVPPENDTADGKGRAVCRAALAEAHPWLVPELYPPVTIAPPTPKEPDTLKSVPYPPRQDPAFLTRWLSDLQSYVTDTELELEIASAGRAQRPEGIDTFDALPTEQYRTWIKSMVEFSTSGKPAVTVSLLREQPGTDTRSFDILLTSHVASSPGRLTFDGRAVHFPYSTKVRYWARVIEASMREVYASKPDSDMGLCLLIRMLYLFGTLPPGVDPSGWRKRRSDTEKFTGEAGFNAFFDAREQEFAATANDVGRLRAVRHRFTVLLETLAEHPRAASVVFSPIVGEILRTAITAYKFWLDEPLRAATNEQLQKARRDILGGDAEPQAEMEYWSENHYIMFASSEYLAGQLWPDETFQPGKGFVDPELKTVWGTVSGTLEMDGARRRDRGRARVLKWLNNRLRFGWAEFNSSGYYREHLFALLNLVDFAQDPQVREKAKVVTDLLMFDVMRFHHKGGIGAAGGRSQFKSKSSAWDNATGDMIEMMIGSRGVFTDGDSQIGAHFATSTYDVPEVLLAIGAHPVSGVDRSRVSILFEEAPKHAIHIADNSDEMRSLRRGYAEKIRKYYPFVRDVGLQIEQTHHDYTNDDDDVVFWWTTSAYLNDQIRSETERCVLKFELTETGVFKSLVGLVSLLAELVDLAPLLDGSTRTRANIVTYRTPQFMMSSVQNFRPGQLNFQSSLHQISLTGALRVFTTAGFSGLDISDLYMTLGSAVAGGIAVGAAAAVTGIFAVATAGGAVVVPAAVGGALVANHALVDGMNPLGSGADVDGPSWWTGYWSLPMVFQEDRATIIAYDFNASQEFLAETGTHVWFPKAGFDRTDIVRASGYDDDNTFASEIIGEVTTLFSEPEEFLSSRGYWIFGLVREPVAAAPGAEPGETYIGVFSNKKPRFLSWEDNEEDTYQRAVEKIREDKKPKDDDGKRDHELAWREPLPRDYFADRDCYANGKNIWIVQLGSKDEFGSYEEFKRRVSEATVKVDDRGDMACTYYMPLPNRDDNPLPSFLGRPAKELSLDYADGGTFRVNGARASTDLYPRFENAYIRSGRVEWGQRAYMIEHDGNQLIHDFTDFANPVRKPRPAEDERDDDPSAALTVRALVIYAKTGDSELEIHTIGTATVRCGCSLLTEDQVFAAGPIGSDSTHDAEWIFLDKAARYRPDLALTLHHRAIRGGDDDEEWDVTFSMKALMGDYTLRECAISFPQAYFGDTREVTTPFSVPTDGWQPWERLAEESQSAPGAALARTMTVAERASWNAAYFDHCDLLAVDDTGRMRHRRIQSCPTSSAWGHLPTRPDLNLANPYSVTAVARYPGHLMAAVVNNGALFVTSRDHDGNWAFWKRIQPYIYPPGPLGIPDPGNPQDVHPAIPGTVFSRPATQSVDGVDLFFVGAQNKLYLHRDWAPDRQGPWQEIDPPPMTDLRDPATCAAAGDVVFTLGTNGVLWSITAPSAQDQPVGQWRNHNPDGTSFGTFTVIAEGSPMRILATDSQNRLWTAGFDPLLPLAWQPMGAPADGLAQGVPVGATGDGARIDVFAVSATGRVVTTAFDSAGPQSWSNLHDDQPFIVARRQPMIVKRVKNQVEVIIAAVTGEVYRTWRA